MAQASSKRDAGKEKFWRKAIAERRASGLTVAEYCQREGLSEKSYYYWHKRLPGDGAGSPGGQAVKSDAPVFLPVKLHAAVEADVDAPGGRIEIVLSQGRVVSLPVSRENLCMVVEVLEGRAC